jgi:putative phage-type endonuclease
VISQGSDAWHTARKGRLTASLFGAALGVSPFMSRQALWKQLTGRVEPFQGNAATEYGTAHEPIALSAYEVMAGEIVRPAEFVRFEDWSGASPDGLVGADGLLEIKCPASSVIYAEWPDHYRAQVIGQLGITKRAWCDCFCWSPLGSKIVERIHHDEEEWQRVLGALRQFWRHVVEDKEPTRQAKFKFKEIA